MDPLVHGFAEYLLVIRSLAKNSVDAYVQDLNDFFFYLNSKKIDPLGVQSEDLLQYLGSFENSRTQNRHLSSINSFYNFIDEHYDLQEKPKASFAKISKTLPKYLESKQILEGLELIDRSSELGLRDYAIILFLFASGVRVSELITIKTQDINDTWIKVVYAKGSKQRVVPIAPVALEALKSYLEFRKHKSEYLFLNYMGKPLSRISIFKITKKYFNVSPHVFRHSYATSLILGGADLMVVSELLGHSNVETTQVYTHIQQKHLKETIQKHHPINQRAKA